MSPVPDSPRPRRPSSLLRALRPNSSNAPRRTCGDQRRGYTGLGGDTARSQDHADRGDDRHSWRRPPALLNLSRDGPEQATDDDADRPGLGCRRAGGDSDSDGDRWDEVGDHPCSRRRRSSNLLSKSRDQHQRGEEAGEPQALWDLLPPAGDHHNGGDQ